MRLRRLITAVAAAAILASCGSSHPKAPASSPLTPSSPSTRPIGGASSTTSATAAPVSLSATTAAWQLPEPVSRPVVVPDGAGFDILGGLATGDVSTSRIVKVDPANGTAEVAGSLALAVHDSAGALLDGHDVVFGGGSYSTVSTVQSWDGSGSAREVAQLPETRSDLASVTVGSTAYIVGGFDGSVMDSDVLATTDGSTFLLVTSLAVPVRYPAVAYVDGYIWVLGGVLSTSEGGTLETPDIQRIDPHTGQSAVVGHLPMPMGHATAVVLAGTLYVLGGRSGTVPSDAILRLDTATSSVEPAGTLPQALSDAGSVTLDGTAYLIGGEVTGPTDPLDTVVILRPSKS